MKKFHVKEDGVLINKRFYLPELLKLKKVLDNQNKNKLTKVKNKVILLPALLQKSKGWLKMNKIWSTLEMHKLLKKKDTLNQTKNTLKP